MASPADNPRAYLTSIADSPDAHFQDTIAAIGWLLLADVVAQGFREIANEVDRLGSIEDGIARAIGGLENYVPSAITRGLNQIDTTVGNELQKMRYDLQSR